MRTTPLWGKNRKQGELRLWFQVRISTVLGTRAVLLGFVLELSVLWNFTAMNLGTIKNLQVLLVLMRCLLWQRLSIRLELI